MLKRGGVVPGGTGVELPLATSNGVEGGAGVTEGIGLTTTEGVPIAVGVPPFPPLLAVVRDVVVVEVVVDTVPEYPGQ